MFTFFIGRSILGFNLITLKTLVLPAKTLVDTVTRFFAVPTNVIAFCGKNFAFIKAIFRNVTNITTGIAFYRLYLGFGSTWNARILIEIGCR